MNTENVQNNKLLININNIRKQWITLLFYKEYGYFPNIDASQPNFVTTIVRFMFYDETEFPSAPTITSSDCVYYLEKILASLGMSNPQSISNPPFLYSANAVKEFISVN